MGHVFMAKLFETLAALAFTWGVALAASAGDVLPRVPREVMLPCLALLAAGGVAATLATAPAWAGTRSGRAEDGGRGGLRAALMGVGVLGAVGLAALLGPASVVTTTVLAVICWLGSRREGPLVACLRGALSAGLGLAVLRDGWSGQSPLAGELTWSAGKLSLPELTEPLAWALLVPAAQMALAALIAGRGARDDEAGEPDDRGVPHEHDARSDRGAHREHDARSERNERNEERGHGARAERVPLTLTVVALLALAAAVLLFAHDAPWTVGWGRHLHTANHAMLLLCVFAGLRLLLVVAEHPAAPRAEGVRAASVAITAALAFALTESFLLGLPLVVGALVLGRRPGCLRRRPPVRVVGRLEPPAHRVESNPALRSKRGSRR